jgi:hypothetical protein
MILPDGKRIVYSGYADNTTLYLNGPEDLDKAFSIFQKYSSISSMRLNDSKCSVIPFGSLVELANPDSCTFRWLNDDANMEKLLGVPVGIKFNNDSIWKDLLLKLNDSIRHWAAQKLSLFGRVHAARSYIGGKAWFFATMVPSKRLSALLWAYVQNNKV